jgi:hypothetical protein
MKDENILQPIADAIRREIGDKPKYHIEDEVRPGRDEHVVTLEFAGEGKTVPVTLTDYDAESAAPRQAAAELISRVGAVPGDSNEPYFYPGAGTLSPALRLD